MSNTKHAPGPWMVVADRVETLLRDANGHHVATFDGRYGATRLENSANATLAAAAPELLAFLKEALLELWRLDDFHGKLPEWYVPAENLVQSFEVEIKR